MADNYFKQYPNNDGFFKEYGGAFIPPILEVEMKKITDAYYAISKSHNFISELRSIRKHYQGRPTPVYYCNRLSEKIRWLNLFKTRRFKSYGSSQTESLYG